MLPALQGYACKQIASYVADPARFLPLQKAVTLLLAFIENRDASMGSFLDGLDLASQNAVLRQKVHDVEQLLTSKDELIDLLKHELQEAQREVAALKLVALKTPQPAPVTSQPNGTANPAPITSQPAATAQPAFITSQPNGIAQPALITSLPRDAAQRSAAAAEQLPSTSPQAGGDNHLPQAPTNAPGISGVPRLPVAEPVTAPGVADVEGTADPMDVDPRHMDMDPRDMEAGSALMALGLGKEFADNLTLKDGAKGRGGRNSGAGKKKAPSVPKIRKARDSKQGPKDATPPKQGKSNPAPPPSAGFALGNVSAMANLSAAAAIIDGAPPLASGKGADAVADGVTASATASRVGGALPVPVPPMSGKVGNVQSIWEEWTIGWTSGADPTIVFPSIQALNHAHGESWRRVKVNGRRTGYQKNEYGRKKKVAREIMGLRDEFMATGMSEEEAVAAAVVTVDEKFRTSGLPFTRWIDTWNVVSRAKDGDDD